MEKHIRLILCGVVVFAFCIMEWVALSDWMAGKWYLTDIGNIQQMMVNTVYGEFMYSPIVAGNHFAWHVTPILFLLIPFQFLSAFPIPLVSAYTLALALAPIPIWQLAKNLGLPSWGGLVLGILFWGNHFVGSLQLSYHFEVFYVLGALFVLAFYYGTKIKAFWVAVALTLAVKEDAPVWLGAFAFFSYWIENDPIRRKKSLRLFVVCIGYFLFAIGWMAIASIGQVGDSRDYYNRMSGISFKSDTLTILMILAGSFAFLPLLSRKAMIYLILPLPVILGNFEFTRRLDYYYSYPFLPFVVLCSAIGFKNILEFDVVKNRLQTTGAVLTVAIIVVSIWQYFQPTRPSGQRRLPVSSTARDDYRRTELWKFIPTKSPLCLQYNLWGTTPSRPNTKMFRKGDVSDTAVVALDFQGALGIATDEYKDLLSRLQEQVDTGQRKILFDRYNFLIISPKNMTDNTKD